MPNKNSGTGRGIPNGNKTTNEIQQSIYPNSHETRKKERCIDEWLLELLEDQTKYEMIAESASQIARGLSKFRTAITEVYSSEDPNQDLTVPPAKRAKPSSAVSVGSSSSKERGRSRPYSFENDGRSSGTRSSSSDSSSSSAFADSVDDRVWTKAERIELSENFIRYYKRREKLTIVTQSQVAQEIHSLMRRDCSIKLRGLMSAYLGRRATPFQPVLLDALEGWVQKEIDLRGEIVQKGKGQESENENEAQENEVKTIENRKERAEE